jgi:hypothetical protein
MASENIWQTLLFLLFLFFLKIYWGSMPTCPHPLSQSILLSGLFRKCVRLHKLHILHCLPSVEQIFFRYFSVWFLSVMYYFSAFCFQLVSRRYVPPSHLFLHCEMNFVIHNLTFCLQVSATFLYKPDPFPYESPLIQSPSWFNHM